MTAPESESLVESIMDHHTTITKPQTLFTSDDDEEEEECDVEVWEMLSKSFIQVQSVLDQNRVLINQVNENHQSKIADNLAKNVVPQFLHHRSPASRRHDQLQEERRRQSLNTIAREFQNKAAGMLIYIHPYRRRIEIYQGDFLGGGNSHELFVLMVDGEWRWMVELVKTKEAGNGWFCRQMNLELQVLKCGNLFGLVLLEFSVMIMMWSIKFLGFHGNTHSLFHFFLVMDERSWLLWKDQFLSTF